MANYVNTQATPAVMDGIRNNLNSALTAMLPYKVSLSDPEKTGIRTMAAGREGYARAVSQIANANINSLAREHNPTDLINKLNYDSRLEELRQLLLSLTELVTETQLANGADSMRMVDAFVANLQASRKINAALDSAMNEIDEWNKRFGRNQDNSTTPPDTSLPGS